ncbi:MAG: hypothetical protein WAU75_24745 [Solirubrobacteraceae bacterium]
MSRRTRTLRYGASITLALLGVACGAVIGGTAGGTAATVLVGIGLVGVVSLIFYEVGLTEDRERAAHGEMGETKERAAPPPRPPGSRVGHQVGRRRPLDRRRGRRRRLP